MYKQAAEERMKRIDEDTLRAKEEFNHKSDERTHFAHDMLKQIQKLRQLNSSKTRKAK